ncbi:hypothetical protein HJG60_008671 [Phyllostomus discolor]|uniref:Uncharacterized protein n=1 Tax=Phyllostomus discolor TaxID=89673 RepID=A0A834DLN2_9CHIR|nr:hypothetical protein HJG60_008671 [Phyllostomus discolor]
MSARARMCAPTRMCPLHMHAPTYWPRRRREPWLPRMMRSLTVDRHRAAAPPPGSQRAEWLLKGRKQGSRPGSPITKLPRVRAQIPAGFSLSCETPCGGAGTLAGATAWSQRLDIYIFSGWSLPLTERERIPLWERTDLRCPALPTCAKPAVGEGPGRGRHPELLQKPQTPGYPVCAAGKRSGGGLALPLSWSPW